jgi:hypothetical protein
MKHDSWRRALARQHSKQDPLKGRAKALRHKTQLPEQSLISFFGDRSWRLDIVLFEVFAVLLKFFPLARLCAARYNYVSIAPIEEDS